MLRPGTPDFAELTDDCSTPSFSTEEYRGLIKEAKSLISGYREVKKTVRDDSPESQEREYLSHRFGEFIKQSKSPEEIFVRFHAFGRALSGRRATTGTPSLGLTCFTSRPGIYFERRHILVIGSYQVPNGTFSRNTESKVLSFLLGRQYEVLTPLLRFRPDSDPPTSASLNGAGLVDHQIGTMVKVSPSTSIHWGDARIENTCPDYSIFIAPATTWTKSKEGECR
jgi:hypothetical protein